MKRYAFLIPISLFLFSCGKRETRHYAGVVVDTAGTPIAQATLSISYRKGASGFSDGEETSYQLGVTKEDGTFSSKFTLRKKEYIDDLSVRTPAPNSKSFSTRQYSGSSNTDMRIVIR